VTDDLRPLPASQPGRAAATEGWRTPFARVVAGDIEALGELYDLAARRLYGLALWRTGNPADAEEVVQEVFVRLAARRAELGDVREPATWLLAACHHAAVDLTRRRGVRAAEPLDACPFLEAPADEPERALDAARASRLVARLPEAQREVVYLRHDAGLTLAAIAEIAGVSLFTVASRHRLALARLRRWMQEEVRS